MDLQDSEGNEMLLGQDKVGPRKPQEPTLQMEVDDHKESCEEEMNHWSLSLVSISEALEQT